MNQKIIITILLAIFSGTCSATISTAGWTGKSEILQSTGYRVMFNCEYAFLNKKIWRKFENACEPVILIDSKELK